MTLEETVVIAAGLKFSYWCKEVENPPKKKNHQLNFEQYCYVKIVRVIPNMSGTC